MGNEQKALIEAMERAFAQVYRLRDVVYADNWDRDLKEAMSDFLFAADQVRNHYNKLG